MQKQEIKDLLNSRIVEVTFTKVNGDTRIMSCTTNIQFIPPSQLPVDKPDKKLIKEDIDSSQIRVYDIKAQGWRSFRLENIVAVK